jgi:arabinofuranosyltransferase
MNLVQRNRTFFIDILISILLIGSTLYYAARYVDFNIPPFEDAAMIMRYSQNLAGGYGIVWNIGENPVDGATDFLFMAASAGLIKLGFTVGQSVRGIGFASHLLTVLIIYWTNRRIHNGSIPFSFVSGLYLAVGTGLSYVSAYFGTPFFALAAASTWTLGLLLMNWKSPERTLSEGDAAVEGPPPLWLSLAFALSGLVTGLIRPEGVILALLMLLAVIVMRMSSGPLSFWEPTSWIKRARVRGILPIIFTFGVVFLTLGGAYFLWRWDYFGYPLPNPFYKKGEGGWQWATFEASMLNTLRLSLPVVFAFILGFRSKEMMKTTIAYLIPILGFAAAFGLVSDEMNYGARFQYAIVPLALMSWIPLVRGFKFDWLNRLSLKERNAYIVALIGLSASLVYYSWFQTCFMALHQQRCDTPYERDGRLEMARMLADYRGKGYVIATTEAGLLPYYSGWTAVDTWGLNDQYIAHNGLTMEYLDEYKPHIIMFHDYYSPLVPPRLTEANLAQRWFSMTILMKTYAEENGYVLAAAFGDSPYDTHYYYVRPDFEDSDRLIERISTFRNYYYPTTGKRSINYATFDDGP